MNQIIQENPELSVKKNLNLKIGILGTRGIPNAYGGFEQFAQFLAEGLVNKGHTLYVYNSHLHPYKKNKWKGINIIHCKDYEHKINTAGQFLYDLNCIRDSRKRNFDILLQLGYTSNSIWYKMWPKKAINIINMDGLEWKRTKYNNPTKRFLKKAESWAAKYGNILIADSIGIQKYLKEKYNKESIYIPYGANIFRNPEINVLSEWNLEPFSYYLLIARMEPENNIKMIIDGYKLSGSKFPLVIVGNTNNKYGIYLKEYSNGQNIKFTEGIYDQKKVDNLRYYSSLYFHGHSVGGTNPSLLEAMACSCPIAAHENIFNKNILSNDAYYFQSALDISNILKTHNRESMSIRIENNLEKITEKYSWNKIIDDYENVFIRSIYAQGKLNR